MKKFLSLLTAFSLLAAPIAWAGGVSHQPAPKQSSIDDNGFAKWVRIGANTDSTEVSIATTVSDTTRTFNLSAMLKKAVTWAEFSPLTTDSTAAIFVAPSWTTIAGAVGAAGDTAQVTIQYSFDGTNWNTFNAYSLLNGQPQFLYRWRNATAAMNNAPLLRVILNNSDISSAITRLYKLSVIVLTKD